MSLCTFNKTGYKSSEKIDSQYNQKIRLLIRKKGEPKSVGQSEKRRLNIIKVLTQNKYFDPRHKEVCFGLEEEAKIGVQIADKLDMMSDQEFMVCSYPYEWMNELKQKTITRVTNKEAVDAILEIVNGS
jgi:hypothetical protein